MKSEEEIKGLLQIGENEEREFFWVDIIESDDNRFWWLKKRDQVRIFTKNHEHPLEIPYLWITEEHQITSINISKNQCQLWTVNWWRLRDYIWDISFDSDPAVAVTWLGQDELFSLLSWDIFDTATLLRIYWFLWLDEEFSSLMNAWNLITNLHWPFYDCLNWYYDWVTRSSVTLPDPINSFDNCKKTLERVREDLWIHESIIVDVWHSIYRWAWCNWREIFLEIRSLEDKDLLVIPHLWVNRNHRIVSIVIYDNRCEIFVLWDNWETEVYWLRFD